MRVFVADKNFYMQLAALAIPVALQNLITFSVSMADTVMLGMLGEVQLSAASIANQLGFIFILFSFGIGSGSTVLVSQFWGNGDVDSIHKVMTIMYRLLFAAAALFTVLAVVFPRQIMSIFKPDELVMEEAVRFLRIVGLSYFFAGVASVTVTVLRGVRTVKISVVVYSCSLVTNAFLNWVLIFGKLGAPALGVQGAAIATCCARFVEFVIAVSYILFFEKKILYRAKMLFFRKLHVLRNFMENALPVVINELIWGTGVAVIAIIINRMGREFTAANAICSVLSQLVTITLFGVANAACVIIGNTVGSGEYEKAREYSKTLIAISFFLGLISSGVVLLLKGPMLMFYNISPLAKTYADQIMTIYAVIVIFVAMAGTILIGVLRGGGDTRFVLLMDVLFTWFICIPLGIITGLYFGWPVWAVYIVLKLDEIIKVVFSLRRFTRGNWINNVTIN